MENPTRRKLLQGAALATATGLAGAPPAAAAPRPNPDNGSHWERPARQHGNNLNLILLVADTFRADNLAAYGSRYVDCPNLNRLAEQSILFEDAYPEGMPTIPTRRTLYTGRRIVPTYHFHQHEPVQLPGWHHLYNEDVTLAETLHEAGYLTALVADIPHLQRPGRNFHRGYYYYEWSRGQEIDYYGQAPRKQLDFSGLYPADYLVQAEKTRPGLRDFLNQYQANRKRWLKLGDSIVEQTAGNALRWIDENHDQGPFFLHVESFDPHEPWDPPADFLHKYLKNPTAHSWPEPPSDSNGLPEEGAIRLRANYAGEASNVDYWYGRIIDKLRNSGLLDNSVIVFLSDHGAMLNEQGQWLKGPEKLRKQVTHVPLLVRLPGGANGGVRVPGFVQIPDVMPTVLGLLGIQPPSRVTGTDLMPFAAGQRSNKRESVVSAFGYIAAVRTPEWNYSAVWNKELYAGKYKPQLYNRKTDPEELKDVASDYPAVVKELQAKLDAYISSGWDMTSGSFNEKAD